MTDADRESFAEAMLILGEAFNEPVSDVRVEAYFGALIDLPMPAVVAATRSALRSLRFFPKPVELREMVEGQAGDNADAAWAEVLTQVRRVGYMGTPTFTDERIGRTVCDVWGSWQRLCQTLPGEGPELLGWVKQFKATFATIGRRDEHKQITRGDLAPEVRKFIDRKIRLLPAGKGAR